MNIEEQRKSSHWLKAGFYGGMQRGTVVISGMLTTMILAHVAIEPAEMGVWSLFLVIAAFVEIMRHGLIKNAVIKYLNNSKESDRVSILSASLVLNLGVTLLVGIILFLSSSWIVALTKAAHLESMILWNNLALLSLIPFSHFEWIMLSMLNFKALFWTYLIRQVITLLLLVFAIIFEYPLTLDTLVLFYAAGIFCGAVTGCLLNRKLVPLRFHLSVEWVKRLWRFGQFAFGTGMSNLVFRSTDTFMVSNLLSSTILVAQQGIAMRVFNLADIPSQLIGDMLFPKSANLSPGNKTMIKYYYEKSVGATLAVIIPAIIFAFAFSKVIILILAGSNYLGAVPYLRILMVISLFLCFLKQFGTIIDSSGQPRVNFLFTTGLAILNIVTSFFFIHQFGFLGAAYSLLCIHILAFIASQSILYRQYGIQFFNCFKYAFHFYPEIKKAFLKKLTHSE